MRKTLVFMALFVFSFHSPVQAKEDKETLAVYDEATSSYQNGNYKDCIEKFEKLLDGLKVTAIEKIIGAHGMLGASYYFEDDRERSKDHFKTVLNFNPNYELSSYDYPPKVIEFFNEIKRVRKLEEVAGRINEPAPTTAIESPEKDNPVPKIMEEGIFEKEKSFDPEKRNPYGNNFIPFGVGQFKNNEPRKALFFLASETIALATAVSTAIAFKSIQNSNGSFDSPSVGRGLKNGFYASLILYLTMTLTGIADACINYDEFPYKNDKNPPVSLSIAPDDKNGLYFLMGAKF